MTPERLVAATPGSMGEYIRLVNQLRRHLGGAAGCAVRQLDQDSRRGTNLDLVGIRFSGAVLLRGVERPLKETYLLGLRIEGEEGYEEGAAGLSTGGSCLSVPGAIVATIPIAAGCYANGTEVVPTVLADDGTIVEAELATWDRVWLENHPHKDAYVADAELARHESEHELAEPVSFLERTLRAAKASKPAESDRTLLRGAYSVLLLHRHQRTGYLEYRKQIRTHRRGEITLEQLAAQQNALYRPVPVPEDVCQGVLSGDLRMPTLAEIGQTGT